MGYSIHYSSPHRADGNRFQSMRLPALTLVSFLIFLFLVNTMWPEGAAYLRDSVQMFRERAVTALSILEENLAYGEPIATVFSDILEVLRQ